MTKDRKIFKLSYVLCISLLGLLCIVGTLATSNSVNAQTISESQVETSVAPLSAPAANRTAAQIAELAKMNNRINIQPNMYDGYTDYTNGVSGYND